MFYQASSSEMFGSASPPQNELTPFESQSPYVSDKVYAYYMVKITVKLIIFWMQRDFL